MFKKGNDLKSFFNSQKKELYFSNLPIIKVFCLVYMLSLLIFSLLGIIAFSEEPARLNFLLLTYATMFIIMFLLFLASRHLIKKDINDLKTSLFMTYFSMFMSMFFVIFISIIVARPTIVASFFLLFNILLPTLYVIRKNEIVFSIVFSSLVFLILSLIYRPDFFITDFYIAISTIIIGIPYNLKIMNFYSKKIYYEQANLDFLSGLPNRRAFDKLINRLYLHQNNARTLLAIIDLDNFKQINDLNGHVYGDKVIKKISSNIREFAKKNNLYAFRIGGDEFVILGLNLQAVKIEPILNELSTKIKNIELINEQKISLSIGACYCEKLNKYSSEELFIKADEALYCVKNDQRGEIKLVVD